MAPSIDYAVSSLLCAEDNIIFYDDDDDGYGVVEESEDIWHQRNHQINNQNKSFYGEGESLIDLPLQSDECLALMIEKECKHLPACDYLRRLRKGDLDLGAREEAINWIRKVQSYYGFGPLSAYLSINYLDRFLSSYELSKEKAWMMQLLAVACLSLAVKMEEAEVPLSLDLQVGDSRFVFEARTILRMELLVLSTLKWRMQAITPFSFIDNFLRKIHGEQSTSSLSIFRLTQLILGTLKGIDFLEFKPSEIAVAVTMSVAGETQTVDIDKAMSVLNQHIQKDRVMKCVELIQDLILSSESAKIVNFSVLSVPQSPIGVLGAACLSYKIDDTTLSSHYSPATKRRKLNKPFEVEI